MIGTDEYTVDLDINHSKCKPEAQKYIQSVEFKWKYIRNHQNSVSERIPLESFREPSMLKDPPHSEISVRNVFPLVFSSEWNS